MRKPFKSGPFRADLDASGTVWEFYGAAMPSSGSLTVNESALDQFLRLVTKVRNYHRRRRPSGVGRQGR